jgi:hypothetical protein
MSCKLSGKDNKRAFCSPSLRIYSYIKLLFIHYWQKKLLGDGLTGAHIGYCSSYLLLSAVCITKVILFLFLLNIKPDNSNILRNWFHGLNDIQVMKHFYFKEV